MKQQERLDIEEKYTSLQEEAQGKTKKLKKVWTMLMAAKSEVSLSDASSKYACTEIKLQKYIWAIWSTYIER